MEIITTLTIIFFAASVTLFTFDRLDHPAIPAYILAGLIAGNFIDTSSLLDLAQLGIAFLVFTFGLKFDPKRLKKEAEIGLNTTTIQVFTVGLLGYFSAQILGFNNIDSIIFSTAAALSSTLIGLQLTSAEIQSDLLHGRISESIHLIQDILGLILIAAIFATTLSDSLYALGSLTFLLILSLLIREYGFDKAAEAADYSSELMMLAGLTTLVGMIGLTTLLGLPMVTGAFAAGLTAAKFPHNMELLETLGSIKDFFSAIFFVALGALIIFPDSRTILAAAVLILLTSIIKPFVTYNALRFQGLDPRTGMLTALSLDQVSEIALIIGIQGFLTGLISQQAFQTVLIGATASMILSSYTKKHEEEIYQKLKPEKTVGEKVNLQNHVILVGYDIQGLRLLDSLEEENARVVVIENDPEKVSALKERGAPAVYGDIMDHETWQEANYTESDLVVSTVPSLDVSQKILDLEAPDDKIVRAEDTEEASELFERGALHVIVPDIASSELLVDHIEGIVHKENYREELRRKNLLEVREYLESR